MMRFVNWQFGHKNALFDCIFYVIVLEVPNRNKVENLELVIWKSIINIIIIVGSTYDMIKLRISIE